MSEPVAIPMLDLKAQYAQIKPEVDEAMARCEAAGLAFTIEVHQPRPDWRYRTLKLRSPSGFDVVLEGPSEPV